ALRLPRHRAARSPAAPLTPPGTDRENPKGPARTMSAPLIISARRVHTLDADAPPASFVAIDGDHIVGVGGPEERAAFEGPETRIADFGDATVVPGLNDSHLHPVWGLELARGMDLTDAGPLEAVRRRVAEEARRPVDPRLGPGPQRVRPGGAQRPGVRRRRRGPAAVPAAARRALRGRRHRRAGGRRGDRRRGVRRRL